MKKILMFVMLGIISFLGINSVSAYSSVADPLTGTYLASNFYTHFDEHIEAYNTYKDNINYLINMWENKHSSDYPYYFIFLSISDYTTNISITLYSSNSTEFELRSGALYLLGSHTVTSSNDPLYSVHNKTGRLYSYEYNSNTNEYTEATLTVPLFSLGGERLIIDSNVAPTFKRNTYQYTQSSVLHTEDYEDIHLPDFISATASLIIPKIEIKDGDNLPTLKSLYDGSYAPNLSNNYTEIDLNNYSYVVLSLKDYTERDTFTSTMYVKGQLCPTTVYNYGLEEKKDYVSGYQTQPCSYYYNDFTPFTSYIKSEDIKNHAIYYLTAYDKSKPNLVKLDNTIYDITYITEENKDNPIVSIGGKNYPVLPYDSLTDSATLTEKNGISNEWTCAKYDTDCLLNSSGIDIDDLFSKPLEFLKDLWSSITSIFNIITEFISLLPETMQSFLYLSFMIAIILGLLKLIL